MSDGQVNIYTKKCPFCEKPLYFEELSGYYICLVCNAAYRSLEKGDVV